MKTNFKPGSLMHLFNVELVDFVRQEKDGSFTPVDWPKDATHSLTPTSWNSRKLYKPNGHGKIQMPEGFALSVCATPLVRKYLTRMKGAMIKASQPLPEGRMVYDVAGSLEGKKLVLSWMIEHMKAKVTKTTLKNATSAQCDSIYRNLMVAHQKLS